MPAFCLIFSQMYFSLTTLVRVCRRDEGTEMKELKAPRDNGAGGNA